MSTTESPPLLLSALELRSPAQGRHRPLSPLEHLGPDLALSSGESRNRPNHPRRAPRGNADVAPAVGRRPPLPAPRSPSGRAAEVVLLLTDSGAEPLAPLGAPPLENAPAGGGLHPRAKSVGALATSIVRLIGALHESIPPFPWAVRRSRASYSARPGCQPQPHRERARLTAARLSAMVSRRDGPITSDPRELRAGLLPHVPAAYPGPQDLPDERGSRGRSRSLRKDAVIARPVASRATILLTDSSRSTTNPIHPAVEVPPSEASFCVRRGEVVPALH